jgi:hypothetical protein
VTHAFKKPDWIEAHRLIGQEVLNPSPSTAVQRDVLPSRTVEDVFHAGLLRDVVLGPQSEINTRIDTFFDLFLTLPIFTDTMDLRVWGAFASGANNRRPVGHAFLEQSLQVGRQFIASDPGRYLIRAMPFENRERHNDTHEVLYFRDSGIHRRLIERTLSPGDQGRLDAKAIENLRAQRLASYLSKRWEAFVVTTILDYVGNRCNAFAFRHEERSEIDLVLEWNDRTPPERWAIEVASKKFNTHPSHHFAEECHYLGVQPENQFVVRRADNCDGGARGRGGVPAISLPYMINILGRRIRC